MFKRLVLLVAVLIILSGSAVYADQLDPSGKREGA
jgi:hypothetical protein